MAGKIKRKLIEYNAASLQHNQQIFMLNQQARLICPLCNREIPAAQCDAHHLIPKSKGGRKTNFLHRICHRQIHALFTETELAKTYSHIEQLLAHPEIEKFVTWVKTKPSHFNERTYKSQRIRTKV